MKGLDLDESLEVAGWLCEDGADFIHVSLWDATQEHTKRPNEHPVPLFRAALPSDVASSPAGAVDASRGRDPPRDGARRGGGRARRHRQPRVGLAGPREGSWEPRRPPLTIAELIERGLNPAFAA